MKKKLFSLVTAVMLACCFTMEVAAAPSIPAPSFQELVNASEAPVTATFTDENGETVEVEAEYTVTQVATRSSMSNDVYKITARASSPKKGSTDDGICWATMSVYYKGNPEGGRGYKMINAAGDWSFGNYTGASPSSTTVTFFPGESGKDTHKTNGLFFNVRMDSKYPFYVETNSCASKISYRTSTSRPLSTLELSVKVTGY